MKNKFILITLDLFTPCANHKRFTISAFSLHICKKNATYGRKKEEEGDGNLKVWCIGGRGTGGCNRKIIYQDDIVVQISSSPSPLNLRPHMKGLITSPSHDKFKGRGI